MTDQPGPEPIRPRVFDGDRSIVAGFSQRSGGYSADPYRSLNLGRSVGDDAETVERNRRRLFEPFGLSTDRLAIAGQVHGSRILTITEPGLYPGYDGLVTREPDIALCITSADCAVVLLADPHVGVIGACHSGWRGTVDDVAGRTVRKMMVQGADAGSMEAYVSPCISADQFEVGEEVADKFDSEYVVRSSSWPRPHVDLKSAIVRQLVRAGVPSESIEVSPHCTFTETDLFFSHRAEHGKTGRMMGFISLRPAS